MVMFTSDPGSTAHQLLADAKERQSSMTNSIADRIRAISSERSSDSGAGRSWQSTWKEDRLKQAVAKLEDQKKEAQDRIDKRAAELRTHNQQRSSEKEAWAADRSERRDREEREWNRKRQQLDDIIKSRQEESQQKAEERDRKWEQRQAELDFELEQQRRQYQMREEYEERAREAKRQAAREQLAATQRFQAEQAERKSRAEAEANRKRAERRQASERERRENKEHRDSNLRQFLAGMQQAKNGGAQQIAAALDAEWQQLEDLAMNSNSTLRVQDIPFPAIQQLSTLRCKKVLRWHPDKFIQRFGARLAENVKDEVMHKVTQVFQSIQELRDRIS